MAQANGGGGHEDGFVGTASEQIGGASLAPVARTNLLDIGVRGKDGRGHVLVGVLRGVALLRRPWRRNRRCRSAAPLFFPASVVALVVPRGGLDGQETAASRLAARQRRRGRAVAGGQARRQGAVAGALVGAAAVDRYGVELVAPGPLQASRLVVALVSVVLVLLVLAAQPQRVELGRPVLL